jgi:hypothetical protein
MTRPFSLTRHEILLVALAMLSFAGWLIASNYRPSGVTSSPIAAQTNPDDESIPEFDISEPSSEEMAARAARIRDALDAVAGPCPGIPGVAPVRRDRRRGLRNGRRRRLGGQACEGRRAAARRGALGSTLKGSGEGGAGVSNSDGARIDVGNGRAILQADVGSGRRPNRLVASGAFGTLNVPLYVDEADSCRIHPEHAKDAALAPDRSVVVMHNTDLPLRWRQCGHGGLQDLLGPVRGSR